MRKEWMVLVALVALCWVTAHNNDAFLKPSNLSVLSQRVALLGIFSIGVAFVIVTGGIDLSVGSVIGLTAVVFAKLSAGPTSGPGGGYGYPTWVAASIALGVALGVGLLQGLLISKGGLQPFIVTLCGMLGFRGIAQTITQGGNITISASDHPRFTKLVHEGYHFTFASGKDPFGEPMTEDFIVGVPIALLAAITLLAVYVLHFSVFGRHLFAIGGNREAARYAGVPIAFSETMVYVISAGLAGLAGILFVAQLGEVTHGLGGTYELYAIAAAVLGGCSLRGGEGSIIGVLLGVTLFRVLENCLNMLQPPIDAALRSDEFFWLIGKPLKDVIGVGWRVDNSKEIVIGAVILGAVLFDKAAQALANYRRRRSAKG